MTDSLITVSSAALQCPLCNGVIEVEELAVGVQIECPECGELFQLATLEPPKLVYALEMEAEAEYPEDERQSSQFD